MEKGGKKVSSLGAKCRVGQNPIIQTLSLTYFTHLLHAFTIMAAIDHKERALMKAANNYAKAMAQRVSQEVLDFNSPDRRTYTGGCDQDCRTETVEKVRGDHARLMELYGNGTLTSTWNCPNGVWSFMAHAFAGTRRGAESAHGVFLGPSWAAMMHYLFCKHLQEYLPANLLLPIYPQVPDQRAVERGALCV